MAKRSMWLWIVALLASGFAAYVLGAPPLTLLIIGILLLCPLAIYFAMGQMHDGQNSRDTRMAGHPNAPESEREPEGEAGPIKRVE